MIRGYMIAHALQAWRAFFFVFFRGVFLACQVWKKDFLFFAWQGWPHPISRKLWVPGFARTQGGGFFQSILQFSSIHYGLYIPLVFLLVFLLALMHLYPTPHPIIKKLGPKREKPPIKTRKKINPAFQKTLFQKSRRISWIQFGAKLSHSWGKALPKRVCCCHLCAHSQKRGGSSLPRPILKWR